MTPLEPERACAMMAAMLTLCTGGNCPLRDRCYRFRLVAHGRHDVFGRVPYDEGRAACEHFDDVEGHRPTGADVATRAYHLWSSRGRVDGHADDDWLEAEQSLGKEFEATLRFP